MPNDRQGEIVGRGGLTLVFCGPPVCFVMRWGIFNARGEIVRAGRVGEG